MERRGDVFDILERLDARVSILETFIFGEQALDGKSLAVPLPVKNRSFMAQLPPVEAPPPSSLSRCFSQPGENSLWLGMGQQSVDEDTHPVPMQGTWLDDLLVSSPTHDAKKKYRYSKKELSEISKEVPRPPKEASRLIFEEHRVDEEEQLASPPEPSKSWIRSPSKPIGKTIAAAARSDGADKDKDRFNKMTISQVEKAMMGKPNMKRQVSSRTVERYPMPSTSPAGVHEPRLSVSSDSATSPRTELKFGLLVQFPNDA